MQKLMEEKGKRKYLRRSNERKEKSCERMKTRPNMIIARGKRNYWVLHNIWELMNSYISRHRNTRINWDALKGNWESGTTDRRDKIKTDRQKQTDGME